MATSKEFVDFVLERLSGIRNVTARPMMGEYLLYADGVLFGGIYDSRLLCKKTDTNADFGLPDAIPYPGAKPMWQLDDVEDERLVEIINATLAGLPTKK